MTACASNCCQDSGCPCVKECDESHCGKHFAEEAAYWAAQFGIRMGMTKEERRAQLERVRPSMADDRWACVYCGREIDERGSCCGEVGHVEVLQ